MMCNNCIHKIVCSKYIACGEVKTCEHYREDIRCKDCRAGAGRWNKKADEKFVGYDAEGKIKYRKVYSYYCGRCALGTAVKTNYCPHCGADMRGEEDG